jgi:hypothetical protein
MDEKNIEQLKELLLIGYTVGAAMEKLGINGECEDITVQQPHGFLGGHDETHEGANTNTKGR